MKAVYKKKAIDRLLDIKAEAEYRNKKIDYILLTPEEYDEIRRDLYDHLHVDFRSYNISYDLTAETVRLFRKDTGYHSNFMVRPETIMGHRIVVAPAEFH